MGKSEKRTMRLAIFLGTLVCGVSGSSLAEQSETPHQHGHADHKAHDAKGHGHAMVHWNVPPAAATQVNPVQATKQSIAGGQSLYEKNCATCHGMTGRGDGPAARALNPKPADLATMASHHPDGDLAWKIAEGRGAMPAWKRTLRDVQIWEIVNYLKSMSN